MERNTTLDAARGVGIAALLGAGIYTLSLL
jgi:hypothetical protein